ncbi:MAG: DUF6328 family protein [Nitrososphaeraceae archaeon]
MRGNMDDVNGNEKRKEDRLVRDYDTVLRESALLTTFAGILFGFLLNISINAVRNELEYDDRIALVVALFSITIAISLFVMPVIYHHIQYPYGDFEKFKRRSHRFVIFGLIPAGFTLYLGLELALSSVTEAILAYILAAIPFFLVYIFFRMRK